MLEQAILVMARQALGALFDGDGANTFANVPEASWKPNAADLIMTAVIAPSTQTHECERFDKWCREWDWKEQRSCHILMSLPQTQARQPIMSDEKLKQWNIAMSRHAPYRNRLGEKWWGLSGEFTEKMDNFVHGECYRNATRNMQKKGTLSVKLLPLPNNVPYVDTDLAHLKSALHDAVDTWNMHTSFIDFPDANENLLSEEVMRTVSVSNGTLSIPYNESMAPLILIPHDATQDQGAFANRLDSHFATYRTTTATTTTSTATTTTTDAWTKRTWWTFELSQQFAVDKLWSTDATQWEVLEEWILVEARRVLRDLSYGTIFEDATLPDAHPLLPDWKPNTSDLVVSAVIAPSNQTYACTPGGDYCGEWAAVRVCHVRVELPTLPSGEANMSDVHLKVWNTVMSTQELVDEITLAMQLVANGESYRNEARKVDKMGMLAVPLLPDKAPYLDTDIFAVKRALYDAVRLWLNLQVFGDFPGAEDKLLSVQQFGAVGLNNGTLQIPYSEQAAPLILIPHEQTAHFANRINLTLVKSTDPSETEVKSVVTCTYHHAQPESVTDGSKCDAEMAHTVVCQCLRRESFDFSLYAIEWCQNDKVCEADGEVLGDDDGAGHRHKDGFTKSCCAYTEKDACTFDEYNDTPFISEWDSEYDEYPIELKSDVTDKKYVLRGHLTSKDKKYQADSLALTPLPGCMSAQTATIAATTTTTSAPLPSPNMAAFEVNMEINRTKDDDCTKEFASEYATGFVDEIATRISLVSRDMYENINGECVTPTPTPTASGVARAGARQRREFTNAFSIEVSFNVDEAASGEELSIALMDELETLLTNATNLTISTKNNESIRVVSGSITKFTRAERFANVADDKDWIDEPQNVVIVAVGGVVALSAIILALSAGTRRCRSRHNQYDQIENNQDTLDMNY